MYTGSRYRRESPSPGGIGRVPEGWLVMSYAQIAARTMVGEKRRSGRVGRAAGKYALTSSAVVLADCNESGSRNRDEGLDELHGSASVRECEGSDWVM